MRRTDRQTCVRDARTKLQLLSRLPQFGARLIHHRASDSARDRKYGFRPPLPTTLACVARLFPKTVGSFEPNQHRSVRSAAQRNCNPIHRKGIELAKAGDVQMLKFFLDRILPKERLVKIDLPTIEHHRDLTAAYAAIVQAVGRAELTPGEGSAVAALIANIAKFIDDAEVEARLRSLETELNYLQAKS